MFGIEMTDSAITWAIIGCVIALVVEVLLFKAACALADVADPSWLFSFVIVAVFFAGRGAAAWRIFEWLKTDFHGIGLYLTTFLASAAVFWLVFAFLYTLVLSVSFKKSFFTATAQAMLDALIGSLAIGITLFVLSLVQIRSPAKSALPPADDARNPFRHVAP